MALIDTSGKPFGGQFAGETIDYHYSLVNVGEADVSAIVVNDLSGLVTCPQTTLAIGASFNCTRSWVR